MRQQLKRILAACVLTLLPLAAARAAVSVIDDADRTVTLREPARRIVSLAPHATELLYAAGAGADVVGIVDYSDYPPEAKRITSVGSGIALDLERIVRLKPDLIVAWQSGNSAAQIARLRELGIPVFESEPRDFAAIASSLERLAHLAGTDATGAAAASAFRKRLQKIEATYHDRPIVTVFYQIWRAPLMTLNDTHPVSRALRVCGGKNVFGALPQMTPTVGVEAVLQANPDAIIASSGSRDDVLSEWRRFPHLNAVAHGNLLAVDGSLMDRSGPRILDGVENLCRQLDAVRGKR
jgi:iron complex transport system substrate-binding protein